MNSIKKLEQVVVEDKYSRKNIRERVMNDIVYKSPKIQPLIDKAIGNIAEYTSKAATYYMSKGVRVMQLKSMDLSHREIVLEILLLVTPIAGAQPIQSVVGQLASLFDYDDILDGVKTAAELVAVVCFADLYDIVPARNSDTGSLMIESKFSLEESTLQYIANTKYLPPMIVPPEELKDNSSCGYLTMDESIILGKGNHHDGHQCLDALNIMNSVALTLDRSMMRFHEKAKDDQDTPIKVANHRRLMTSSKIVYKELIAAGNKFYFTHKYDKRGREYSQGYHVNIQSTSYKKSLINLHEKHLITGA